jgi:hypothetical protein
MDDNIVGLAAVVLIFGLPLAVLYTFYRVRKLRTDERLAALARGVSVPMEPDLNEAARSRRWGILLSSAAVGYIACCALIARVEPDAWTAAAVGMIPLAVGLGCFVDFTLIRRDAKTS